jgi:hypothetical protein
MVRGIAPWLCFLSIFEKIEFSKWIIASETYLLNLSLLLSRAIFLMVILILPNFATVISISKAIVINDEVVILS